MDMYMDIDTDMELDLDLDMDLCCIICLCGRKSVFQDQLYIYVMFCWKFVSKEHSFNHVSLY
jgi:hypothetical protein